MSKGIWSAQVNLILSLMFVGSFTFGAGLVVWDAYYGANPIADLLATQMY